MILNEQAANGGARDFTNWQKNRFIENQSLFLIVTLPYNKKFGGKNNKLEPFSGFVHPMIKYIGKIRV